MIKNNSENPNPDTIEKLANEAWQNYEAKVLKEARSAFNRLLIREFQKHGENK